MHAFSMHFFYFSQLKYDKAIHPDMAYELYDLLITSARGSLILQQTEGSFPHGHDGPWYYEDTKLRTTSHWALLISKAYELTKELQYRDAALKACDYLISSDARPYGHTFYCRKQSSGKDLCNGLIGQAWVLEALINIGLQLNEEKYLMVARDVIRILPYDFHKHSWSAVEINGKIIGEIITLNQQIWLSAMAVHLADILNDNNLLSVGKDFFEHLHAKVIFIEKGLIKHNYSHNRSQYKEYISQIFMNIRARETMLFLKRVSIGYLPFLLYGLAYVMDKVPAIMTYEGLRSKFMIKALKYIENNYPYGYLEDPDSFRWSYNPVGIEMAYVLQVINRTPELIKGMGGKMKNNEKIIEWLGKQFVGYYCFKRNLLNLNTRDPEILSSRLYEAVRLVNYKFRIQD